MDFKAYAESFGAKGVCRGSAEALEPTLRAAMDVDGPAVVAIPVDYRDNPAADGPAASESDSVSHHNKERKMKKSHLLPAPAGDW